MLDSSSRQSYTRHVEHLCALVSLVELVEAAYALAIVPDDIWIEVDDIILLWHVAQCIFNVAVVFQEEHVIFND